VSGGRIAISGFDYQTIVILDQLFDHFDQHPGDARARPEGTDDLDLIWTDNGQDCHRFVQVKKPSETDLGVLKNEPWRLSDVASELIPNALKQFSAQDCQQVWILGDAVQSTVRNLISAGMLAPIRESLHYWSVVHLIARAIILDHLPSNHRKALLKWRFKSPPSNVNDAQNFLVITYGQMLSAANADVETVRRYQERVIWVNQRLPKVLSQVEILDNYGSEADVAKRFKDRLQREYRLSAEVVEHNLFGNFRSFINDVAKRPGEVIDRWAFEVQLRSAWPQMSSATEPPIPPVNGILRPDLINGLVKPGVATVVEVIGISGSGKTTLAGQAAAVLKSSDPVRLPVYVRVRADAAFRDVISGVAFHLLRRGIPDLFGLAVESKSADETVIDSMAKICSGLSQSVQLLLDLVEGTCNTQFSRDLGLFARALVPGSCRLVVFGQQSTFRTLSLLEAESAGISTINMRGFRWEEFARLVEYYHSSIDRDILWDIFNRITVGRPAGLYAKLAESLARQTSINAMLAVASSPPEDMVSAAEQSRFDQLAPGVRSAAEHLVCFALPFRRPEAEAAFPDENIGAAIKALVDLGLLRIETEGLLEMHETVRAGLESGIASAVRQTAHSALAEWYGRHGDFATQIFHLDKAGRPTEADRLGRETFLRGEAWLSLARYVTRRALVTAQEVVALAARPERIDGFFILESVLSGLTSEGLDGLLMDLLAQQYPRYVSDYNWIQPMVETILALNPDRLKDLLLFTVTKATNAEECRNGLSCLLSAARRGYRLSTIEIVDIAKSQSKDVQRQLLPLLLLDSGRAALMLAFEIFARPTDEKRRSDAPWSGVKLKIERYEDVVEILAALPKAPTSQMISTRSLAFGSVGSLIWAGRHQLRPFCVDILGIDSCEVEIKSTAWRVLIFIGHPALESLVDLLAPDPIPLDYALLGPAFAPTAYDAGWYEGILCDPSAPPPHRQTALTVLFFLDVDFGSLRSRLAALPVDPLSSHWDSLFLLLFARQPFIAGVPILQDELALHSPLPPWLLYSCLDMVSETTWPVVTDLLMQGVVHRDPSIQRVSILGLARRRSKRAFTLIQHQLGIEPSANVILLLAQALTACGPTSANDLAGKVDSPDIALWQCIIAMRTRDGSFAPQLVKLATDTSVHWVIRRAAIWAAGRSPFKEALQMIAPVVLAENTPLTMDCDENLQAHASISSLLKNGVSALLVDGEANFIAFIGEHLEQQWSDQLIKGNSPLSSDAARWLYANLISDPSPIGIQRLLNRIQTPLLHAAVVRAFRLCGHTQGIEDVLANTSSVWLAAKCLQERCWAQEIDPDLGLRLRSIIAATPCSSSCLLNGIVDELLAGRRKSRAAARVPSAQMPKRPQPELRLHFNDLIPKKNTLLDYSAVVQALRGTLDLEIIEGQPMALAQLDREEVQKLIVLADPANDPSRALVKITPKMTFTAGGHVVVQESSTSNGGTSIPERLRPAIAAANRFDLPMPWHSERLRWPWVDTYGAQFIASLCAQGDADRFYQALQSEADILLPLLGSSNCLKMAKPLLDERLASILQRHLWVGDDIFFESLCNSAQHIPSSTALPLLAGLLKRWASCIESTSRDLQARNIELWRGFARLREHPRFREIPGWRKTLENILAANIQWFHKQDIVRFLESDPGSYVSIENLLLKVENWLHFRFSEIDTLDEAAERLFHETVP